jgi:hypothetical protein
MSGSSSAVAAFTGPTALGQYVLCTHAKSKQRHSAKDKGSVHDHLQCASDKMNDRPPKSQRPTKIAPPGVVARANHRPEGYAYALLQLTFLGDPLVLLARILYPVLELAIVALPVPALGAAVVRLLAYDGEAYLER